ncbi:MAG: cobalt ECF transporter T component CbiQ [Candidatus Eisenbacteria bacterium]|nr:cobalt ECF transporter T component CbiQ [Candidatus Eisenbacteria bacterium]
MRQHLLSPYQHGQSPIHRLPATLKLIVSIIFVLGIVLLPRGAWLAYAIPGLALLLIAALCRVRPRHLATRLLWLEPFAVGAALLSLLQPNGTLVFLTMLSKSTLCLFCMVLLSSTTRFSEILSVLWRFRVPALFVTTLALTYRYLFLLVDEMQLMLRARRSRSFSRGRLQMWRAMATTIAQLFVRTSEHAERIYAAMCARGWRT